MILDLIDDCSRFVSGFFEVISTSAPHICHSALPLSPQTSIVQKLYEQYSHPIVRIVQGVPMSWDSSIATTKCSGLIFSLQWSPCTHFIAILLQNTGEIQILDAVTLKQLNVYIPPFFTDSPVFSLGSHLLTWAGDRTLITWDLQTGVQIGKISVEGEQTLSPRSITHSGCGTMFGVLFLDNNNDTAIINTYNALLGTPICSFPIERLKNPTIWTDGQCLQFVTFEPGFIIIWEVGFASKCPPTKAKSLPTPNNFNLSRGCFFLPSYFQLAFILKGTVSVWDAQHSRFLLTSVNIDSFHNIAFSPNGCFFACVTEDQ